MCFQYTTKLRHNVVYVFSIFNSDVIIPNLGNYGTDMTISSTAPNCDNTSSPTHPLGHILLARIGLARDVVDRPAILDVKSIIKYPKIQV